MSDIVERLRRKVFHGPTMEASHTKTVEWQAADEIERLRAALGSADACIVCGHIDQARKVIRAALEGR